MMFLQVIHGKVADVEEFRRVSDRWRSDVRPGAVGYLGSTLGVTPDGRAMLLARFESAEAAETNASRPEQGAWWEEASKVFDGDPSFHDCAVVDTAFGGGSNDAGFVQVIQGRAKDQESMRSQQSEMEAELRQRRPDILGLVVGWHGDGGFTQAVYFTSAAAAREQEAATENDELRQRFISMIDGTPEFFDLEAPELD